MFGCLQWDNHDRRRTGRRGRRRVARPMTDFLTMLTSMRLLPVVTAVRPAAAATVAEALEQAGLPLAEVTLRTPDALDSLREMAARPGVMVGAGTVLRPQQVEDSLA